MYLLATRFLFLPLWIFCDSGTYSEMAAVFPLVSILVIGLDKLLIFVYMFVTLA